MSSFTTVNKVDKDGFICQYDIFNTRKEANARIAELHKISGYEDAFIVDNDATEVNGNKCFQKTFCWPVDKVNKTVSFDQKAYDADMFNENMIILREERDRRLVATDITVLPDRWESMNNDSKTAWSVYRQALRDLPANTPDPTNITWPTKP